MEIFTPLVEILAVTLTLNGDLLLQTTVNMLLRRALPDRGTGIATYYRGGKWQMELDFGEANVKYTFREQRETDYVSRI